VTLDLLSWTPATDPRNPRNAHPRNDTPATDELQGAQVIAGGVRNNPPRTPPDPHCGGGVENKGCDPARLEGPQSGRDCGGTPTAGTPCGPRPTGENSAALIAGDLTGRPYQVSAITAAESHFAAGRKSTLVVLPTGTGKTIVLALLLLRYKLAHEGRRGRGLVIAHRTELISQNAAKCRAAGLTTSIEQGESRASRTSDVVVASVQTLQRARLERFTPDDFDYIVIDEAHHAEAKGYQNIIERFPNAQVLGLTASPMRLDGKPLGNTFESVAYSYELRQAIRDEWLVPIVARRVRITDVDMSRVRAAHGDLAKEELGVVLRDAKALQGVISPTLSMAGSRRTLIFAVDVAHAHALADLLNESKPGSAMALDGTMPATKRKAVLELFRAGTFQYLVNCEVLTEGFDDPGIQCVVLARPTMSVALLIQMIGRGTRLLGLSYAESVANGKRDVLVLDMVGNLKHRLAGPADALAGMLLPPELAAEIDDRLANGKAADVSLLLADCEDKTAEKLRAKTELALTYYRTKEVDPFVGEFIGPPSGTAAPASPEQLAKLKELGFSDPPEGITDGMASAIIAAARERSRRGLSTLAQIRCLRSFGCDARRSTFKRAGELMAKMRKAEDAAKAEGKGRGGGFNIRTLLGEPEYDGRRSW
jgi:superfamily II DNA or RNA helicase